MKSRGEMRPKSGRSSRYCTFIYYSENISGKHNEEVQTSNFTDQKMDRNSTSYENPGKTKPTPSQDYSMATSEKCKR